MRVKISDAELDGGAERGAGAAEEGERGVSGLDHLRVGLDVSLRVWAAIHTPRRVLPTPHNALKSIAWAAHYAIFDRITNT
ncbi:MAG: hypothetical protein ACOYL3_28445, partial [Desulfuromonadaceae bacterium]